MQLDTQASDRKGGEGGRKKERQGGIGEFPQRPREKMADFWDNLSWKPGDQEQGRAKEKDAVKQNGEHNAINGARAGEAVTEDVSALRQEVERLRKRVEDDDTVAIVRKMFALGTAEDGDGDENGAVKRKGIGDKIAGACDAMWGGPVAPREDDTVLSWFGNFCGGVTTAHGINRVFDEGQGPVRRGFWIVFFLASFVVLWNLVYSAILQYMQADVSTSIFTEDGSSTMPMVTVCNSSPLRCGCEVLQSSFARMRCCAEYSVVLRATLHVQSHSTIASFRISSPRARARTSTHSPRTRHHMSALTSCMRSHFY